MMFLKIVIAILKMCRHGYEKMLVSLNKWCISSAMDTAAFLSLLSPCVVSGLSSFSNMFGKKKKRLEISAPSNFEHRVHTGFDPHEQKFTGLPQQWQSLLADTANRPKPMVDPSYITPIQLAPMKVQNSHTYMCFTLYYSFVVILSFPELLAPFINLSLFYVKWMQKCEKTIRSSVVVYLSFFFHTL